MNATILVRRSSQFFYGARLFQVLVDGKYTGSIGSALLCGSNEIEIHVGHGDHCIEITMIGVQRASVNIAIQKGETVELHCGIITGFFLLRNERLFLNQISNSTHIIFDILGDYNSFLNTLFSQLVNLGFSEIELDNLQCDHICYRAETFTHYENLKKRILNHTCGNLIEESMIDGRPISIFQLCKPITYRAWKITCLELVSPKLGSYYKPGLEHIELVILPDGNDDDMIDSITSLNAFANSHPYLQFDFKSSNKHINAHIKLNLDNNICVKFHARPLLDVCKYERLHSMNEAVPEGYIDCRLKDELKVSRGV